MFNTMLYIQRRCGRQLETVDQCNSKTEAKHIQTEYQLSDSDATYYISGRACKAWYDN